MKNKKRPYIDSELPVFDRTFPIVYSTHKEKICGSEAVRIYAKGMNLIVDGFIKEGIALLEDSYRELPCWRIRIEEDILLQAIHFLMVIVRAGLEKETMPSTYNY